MSSSSAGAAAFNAGVKVDGKEFTPVPPRTSEQQAYLDAIAEQAEQSVAAIEEKLAGMRESLVAAKAEAKRARAEARDGVN